MNFNRKNRIWKKLSAWGMAFLITGMVLGGGQATVYAEEEAYIYEQSDKNREDSGQQEYDQEETDENTGAAEFEENSETEEAEIIKSEIEASELDEIQSEENAEGSESEEDEAAEDIEDTKGEDSDLSDDSSKEDDKETDNEKKKADFTLHVSTDENIVKAGSDLVYTVTLENTGDVRLENIRLQAQFTDQKLQGEWSEENLEHLDSGIKKTLYLTVKLPEDQEQAVSVKMAASAETVEEEAENTVISREAALDTDIIPLKASFEVTKTADRSVAVPGDKILFQICIRNTGERTLHSVVTTERFQLGNVPVQFLEKEGVVLNRSKTKARIEKIEPGKAAGLQAMVTLPENIKEQELLNEVTVTTLETGEQVMTSQTKIQVKATEESGDSVENVGNDSVDTESSAVSHSGESYPASTHPKTGDPYQPLLWLAMIPGSLLAAGWIRRRM